MVQKGICDKRAHFKMELISNKPNQSKIKILQPHHEIFVTQQGNFKIDYFFLQLLTLGPLTSFVFQTCNVRHEMQMIIKRKNHRYRLFDYNI